MRKFPRSLVIVINLILVVSMVAIWIAFAPLKIGGQTSYVMVNGNSMEPGFHGGDLAIVKAAPIYNVGDVVTYGDSQMGAYVIHRIIGIEQDGYVLKGDNNTWIDPHRPTRAEVLGKLWIHVPKLGLAIQWLRLPINMALTMGLLGGILMASIVTPQTKQKGKGKHKPAGNPTGWFEMVLYTLGLIALLFLGLSIFAFSRPLMRTAHDIKYQQNGVFFYSAAGNPRIYDADTVRSGEPIFLKLTCLINVGFVYNLVGEQLQDVTGSYQLNAYITDNQSGWKRTIPIKTETTFSGNSFSTMTDFDLCQVQALLDSVEQETGFRSGTYTLTIQPRVVITAKAAGQELSDSFESNLVFNFDKVHFYLTDNKPESLRLSKDALLKNTATQANTVSGLGFEFGVLELRILGLTGLGFALLGLLFLGWYVFNAARRSQEALIRIKYGAMLMDVYDRGFESISPVIDVTTIDDLAKLADRQDAMILHMTRDFLQYYLVQSEGTTYRYVISDGHDSTPKTEVPHTLNLG